MKTINLLGLVSDWKRKKTVRIVRSLQSFKHIHFCTSERKQPVSGKRSTTGFRSTHHAKSHEPISLHSNLPNSFDHLVFYTHYVCQV